MDLSLCVLARGRPDLLELLITDVAAFLPGRDMLEVCVADNSASRDDRAAFRLAADSYVQVTDRELWYEGFAAAKNRATRLAENAWVVVADLGERWQANAAFPLIEAVEKHGVACPCFAVCIGGETVCGSGHGRVFDRTRMRLLGLIHEEPYEKRTAVRWAAHATKHPFVAFVEEPEASISKARKEALYDHLLDLATREPSLRTGTARYWLDEYWPKRVASGVRVLSFDEWQELA